MGEIRAAGFVIFRRLANQIQYLLMQASYEPFHFTPPKGHVEEGEDNLETAKRETKEEAGIDFKDLKMLEFTKSLRYEVKGKPKVSVYFLAELVNPETPVILSHEHKAYEWLLIDDACKKANFQDMQELLRECNAFLTKN
ncbi:bis(5'-nucleosyl)-tetraphosphatase [asymmetrical] [Neocloeon triangulifer]|uniref:bis(5'-nucleosyl)-tetraphosphatase [asymmetrical] n=1 Tax=Neocloeon triangulifer TaxID=2078957 RepID=UPI00286F595F|nr:bis(5'-nucleosyl)-tetraphosphatase [asymmetrical] [Neocloeon triangulifer]XP_059487226.1 bis(5'-nucleosyl)-tetraphosphatase [asymmetrical] [Neocloeon triangulifer]